MPDDHFTIRLMSRDDLTTVLGWAAAEGWNPGLYDADCFLAADPEGFFVGLLDGVPIASISGVRFGGSYGFIGLYIVNPEHRGRGYGMRMWQAALEYLGERMIGLDGVVEQQPRYAKSGFTRAYANIRFQGDGGGAVAGDSSLVPLADVPFDGVAAYDRVLVPEARESFLRCWIGQPESLSLGIVEDGALKGYGMIRRSHTGCRIGPLFADSPERAECLFLALKAWAGAGVPVFIDSPAVNPAAVDLARRHGFSPVFETARMYTGGIPDLPLARVFGVATLELG